MKPLPEHELCVTCRYLTAAQQVQLRALSGTDVGALLRRWQQRGTVEPFVPDLALLEQALIDWEPSTAWPLEVKHEQLNPTLRIVEVGWSGLLPLCEGEQSEPQPQPQRLGLWQMPHSGERQCRALGDDELLALKIVAERHDRRQLAERYQRPVGGWIWRLNVPSGRVYC